MMTLVSEAESVSVPSSASSSSLELRSESDSELVLLTVDSASLRIVLFFAACLMLGRMMRWLQIDPMSRMMSRNISILESPYQDSCRLPVSVNEIDPNIVCLCLIFAAISSAEGRFWLSFCYRRHV